MATFSGMGYPIVSSPKGYFPVTKDIDLIKGDMIQLLMTSPGERIMMSQFGTPLNTLMFEPNDNFLAERAKAIIAAALAAWEPRVVIDQIEVTNGITQANRGSLSPYDDLSQANNTLFIQILFRDPGDIKSIQELVLQVPLGGGNTNGNSNA